MSTQRIHFPRTTGAQRRLLFETWEATGDVEGACRTAHVGIGTFYYWKPRFAAGSYAAVEEFQSHAPQRTRQTAAAVEQQVIDKRRAHRDWGKRRLADELAKENNWVRVVSPNTVRRILQAAGLWDPPEEKPHRPETVSRTADQPGQTINVDLCFVPATHEAEEKLPAVSGSSGRLVVERRATEGAERPWPGRIFEDASLDYEEAMQAFVTASQAETRCSPPALTPAQAAAAARQAERQALRQTEAQLRAERRQVRKRRQQEDEAWRELRAKRNKEDPEDRALAPLEGRRQRGAQPAPDQPWRELRAKRRATLAQRQREDEQWRQQRQALRERLAQVPLITSWIAILVLVDNCTRQCLGLPLFEVGPRVTAEMVVTALRALLPPELQFLISDRGTHFTAQALTQLAQDREFLHVPVARHRPQSNGIAERFVRTFKEWLANHSWQTVEELAALLEQFRAEYNDRPHQGLPIPGLSPNEFANRIWLL